MKRIILILILLLAAQWAWADCKNPPKPGPCQSLGSDCKVHNNCDPNQCQSCSNGSCVVSCTSANCSTCDGNGHCVTTCPPGKSCNGQGCCEGGPYYGEWYCCADGSIVDPGALSSESQTFCVGGSASTPDVTGTQFSDGQECQDVSFDCKAGYQNTDPETYSPYVEWDPYPPDEDNPFTSPGVYTYDAWVWGVPGDDVCGWIGPEYVDTYTVTVVGLSSLSGPGCVETDTPLSPSVFTLTTDPPNEQNNINVTYSPDPIEFADTDGGTVTASCGTSQVTTFVPVIDPDDGPESELEFDPSELQDAINSLDQLGADELCDPDTPNVSGSVTVTSIQRCCQGTTIPGTKVAGSITFSGIGADCDFPFWGVPFLTANVTLGVHLTGDFSASGMTDCTGVEFCDDLSAQLAASGGVSVISVSRKLFRAALVVQVSASATGQICWPASGGYDLTANLCLNSMQIVGSVTIFSGWTSSVSVPISANICQSVHN